MLQLPHPDELEAQQRVKQITHGGTQAADDKAMEAMWQAIESGMSREDAETIFSNTYQKVLYGIHDGWANI